MIEPWSYKSHSAQVFVWLNNVTSSSPPWHSGFIQVHLPSLILCSPGFEFRAHNQRFFMNYLINTTDCLFILSLNCEIEQPIGKIIFNLASQIHPFQQTILVHCFITSSPLTFSLSCFATIILFEMYTVSLQIIPRQVDRYLCTQVVMQVRHYTFC